MFEEVEPWHTPVDGVQLLDDLAASVQRFIVLPKHAAGTIALWVVFTYALDSTAVAPMLSAALAKKDAAKRRC